MISEKQVDTLKPGNVFRDWLIDILDNRIRNKRCDVKVYEIGPASHTVCRYEFIGENYGVIAKFYAEQKGSIKNYDPVSSMNREFRMLKRIGQIIDVPRAIAVREDFHCVLVTERVKGEPLYIYIESENGLYDRLTAMAGALRKLHDNTRSDYCKVYEFSHFHNLLDQLHLNSFDREIYNHLLGEWWYSNLIDQDYGCLIHNDANPENYIFHDGRVFVLDFESSWDHANFVHDLGIVAAELKHYYAMHKGDGQKAEPYIGHFLWHYSRSEAEFRKITSAMPFFMALGLLRMAKLNTEHSEADFIFRESIACLEAKH
jgi:tRNA A-37 threonylcarbamoyl transferase component Bud32